VYAGQWRGLPVAVKVVSQAAPLDGQLVAEFRREIATMAALPPHPHVLPLLAACTAPPHLALITPFCGRGALIRHVAL
jgi:serine/threonine protein kinase